MKSIDKYAKRYTRFYTDDCPSWIQFLARGKVLDIGAGDGAILYALRNSKAQLNALEISPIRLGKVFDLNIAECFLGDATKMPPFFTNGFFDFAYCHQVIEHVSNDEALLKEAHRVLKPERYFYLSTVFKKKFRLAYHRCNGQWTLDPTHLREYSNERELLDKVEKYFRVIINKKELQWFSLTDFILKRLGIQGYVYEKHNWLKQLRKIKLPIFGYYIWELVLWKN